MPSVPFSSSDGLMVSMRVPVPTRGVMDGVDPAQIDWDADFAPGNDPTTSLENVRLSSEQWLTRLGYQLWTVLPGSGSVRWLSDLYASSGAITRLAAQGNGTGAQLFEKKEGTDAVFVAASGGAGVGGTSQNLFQGVINADRMYWTDRFGALRKYRSTGFLPSTNHCIPVASPAAPTAAPTATPRPYFSHALDWGSWIDSNAGTFSEADDTANNPPPSPGTQTRLLSILSTAAKGETISWPTQINNINSHTLAFYLRETPLKAPSSALQLDFGLGSPIDYGIKLRDVSQIDDEWYPIFADIADVTTLNYLRFRVLVAKSVTQYRVTNVILPGRLEGEYRWIYTHYDSTNGRESAPSVPTNGGQPLDFSAVGISWDPTTAKAFSKSCALSFTSDSGVDTSTDKMRVYRSGGVPSLTIDENGNDLWLRVAEIPDFHTTFSASDAANLTAIDLTSTTGLAVGMYLVLEPGVVGKEEYVQITGVSGAFVNITLGGGPGGTTAYSHASGAVVRIAFIDNVANEQIDLTTPVDIRRDDPPTGARWVIRSPEGRLILMNYTDAQSIYHPCGIAFSNKPTPDRPNDFEVFPDGVDPLTTQSLTQGFRVDYTGGVAADEEIVWGGYYQGWLSFFTRRGFYVCQANSQAEWGPTSIQRIHSEGCIAGDTVQEVNGILMWVGTGPRIMRWTGSGEPQSVSDLRVNVRLNNAPQAFWGNWFSKAHTIADGHYLILYYTPQGQTQNTQQIQYNTDRDSFEPVTYYDTNANPIAYQAATVRAGNLDSPDLYQVDTLGNIVQTEVGLLDGTAPIRVRWSSWKIPLRAVHPYWSSFLYTSLVHSLLIRLVPVNDAATVQLTTGGSEYPSQTMSYPINLNGTVDHEIKIRAHRTLVGRWLQVTVSGAFVNRPGFRDLSLFYEPWRVGRVSRNAP